MRINLRDPSTQKWVLGIGLVFGVLYGYANFVYLPRRDQAARLEGDIKNETQMLAKGKRVAATYQSVQEAYAQLLLSWDVAQTLLPTQKEMEGLLRSVATEGQRHDVEFLLFRPLAPVERPYYWENAIAVKTLSSYHDLGRFLSSVAALDRIVNINNLRLTAFTPSHGRSPNTVEADFVATIYVFKDIGKPVNVVSNDGASSSGDKSAGGD
jgi:type IV pilus assembly protein PilO